MNLNSVQQTAVERIVESYLSGSRLALIQMAQGTGKTLVARAALKRIAAKKQTLSVAWIYERDAELSYQLADSNKAPEPLKVTYLKYSQLISGIASATISYDAFDVLLFIEPTRVAEDLEKVTAYFSGFKLLFSSVLSTPPFFSANQQHLIFSYTFDHALADGLTLSLALQSKLSDLSNRLDNDFATEEVSEGLKRAQEDSRALNEVLTMLLEGKVSVDDIRGMQEKRTQLKTFQRLLNDASFFRSRIEGGAGPESVWQKFFQENQWIFGFGLNYLFNTPLQDGRLEQVVAGHSVKGAGKRVDALLSSNGMISSLCFAEIKTHEKPLLRQVSTSYRPGAWAISDELAGGIAQLQRTVQVSMENLKTSLTVKDDEGFDCGEKLYMYKPKSFLVIGTLAEFTNQNGSIHEDRFSSFQMFRNALSDVQVITFDELYERAKGLIGPAAELSS
ncbi:Shedu anti-phage system protein SduA domain-containing protein [Pseudomonas sp. SCA2728.1_7]|jgi:hypothetical protein|uniref:Shedu anti-phage system protein SduA domain-containing protein n=1 Tax=Pseudomonas sp. SCA2728.1_7 TaxID=2825975 RepID=UPI001BAEDCF5|nr:Shedu anti-phage system protein SduA domain-containing protein [Pseudomonas sp. SCA2728.1_7]QUE91165.1 DUF4263 domain-containing protein [Pseudomonas sp. SCA2728.1_7]